MGCFQAWPISVRVSYYKFLQSPPNLSHVVQAGSGLHVSKISGKISRILLEHAGICGSKPWKASERWSIIKAMLNFVTTSWSLFEVSDCGIKLAEID